MSFREARGFTAVLAILASSACSRPAPRPVERVAIVAFENLTPSPESSWAGRALASLVTARTAGDAKIQTFEAPTLRDAQSRFATRSVSGYLTESNGAFTAHATIRDEVEGRDLSAFTASGDLAALSDAIARRTGAAIREDAWTPKPEAVRALFSVTSDDPAQAVASVQQAIQADPQYGAAWLAWIELNARMGRRDEVEAALDKARQARLTPAQHAQIDVLSAEVAGDRNARANALLRLARAQPGSTVLLKAAASAWLEARNYGGAVQVCDALLELTPDDETALNLRGYSYLYAGDQQRAVQAFEEYRQRLPGSANAIDSLGEAMFYFGRFAEAEKLFLEAHAKNPAQLNGFEPARAAFARFMAGDLAGADTLFASYLAERRKRRDPLADLRAATWQRLTRRPSQAPNDPLSQAMESLWILASGDRDRARQIATTVRSAAQHPVVANLSGLALLLSQPSATPGEWQARILRALSAPEAGAQRNRLLGWALLLDKHPREAAGVWRDLFLRELVETANDERMLLVWSLVDSDQIAEARKAMPYGFMPPASLDPSIDLLAYPRMVEARRKLAS